MTTPSPVAPRPLGRLASRVLLAGLLLSLVATVLFLVRDNDAFLVALVVMGGFGLLLAGLPSVLFLIHSRREPPPEVPREARVAVWFSAIALVLFGALLVAMGVTEDALADVVIGVVVGIVGLATIARAVRFRAPAGGPTRLAYGRSSVVGAVLFLLVTVMMPKFACGCGNKGKAYQASVKYDLTSLVTAEQAYFADHQRFAAQADRDSLIFHASGYDSVVIDAADARGFRATGTHPYLPGLTCGVWLGTPPADGMHGAPEATPRCWHE